MTEMIKPIFRLSEHLNWIGLSGNTHPFAILLLEENLDKVNIFNLCNNPNAIHIIDKLLQMMDEKSPYYYKNDKKNDKNKQKTNIHSIFPWSYPSSSAIENQKNLILSSLHKNPNAIPLVEKYMYSSNVNCMNWLSWFTLSRNPNAIHLLEKNMDKINWDGFSGNPCSEAIRILEQNMDKINWKELSGNPCLEAVRLLEQNIDKINWNMLCSNPCSEAVSLLESKEQLHQINWQILSANPCSTAVHLLKKNIEFINWTALSGNSHPDAVRLLEQNIDRISWFWISENINAIPILERNLDKISDVKMSRNYNAVSTLLCKLDYVAMRENMKPLAEELAAVVFRPMRIQRMCDKFHMEFIDWIEMMA